MLGSPCHRLNVVRSLTSIACLAMFLAVSGCSPEGTNYDTTKDDGAINVLLVDVVESTGDYAANNVWDKASMPKVEERAKYKKFNFSATEKVFDGASAKIKVEIKDQTGAVLATKDWTATKADGAWKLQQAPLP